MHRINGLDLKAVQTHWEALVSVIGDTVHTAVLVIWMDPFGVQLALTLVCDSNTHDF